ncbi:MAG: hypothetical protein QNJ16_13070 [Rhodobacter sp.]|nr:hypothetical protein [Rhodobacter sp.]
MIFGTYRFVAGGVETQNDTYMLQNITAISARRPFLGAGLSIAALLAGFGAAFHDLLFAHEWAILGGICTALTGVSLWLGRLQLLSRDLRGLDLGTALYGSYRHLNRLRRETAAAIHVARKEDRS